MALLTAEAMKSAAFREICGTQNPKLCYGNPPYDRWLSNSNKLLSECEGVIGVKTGFTDKARRCLVSACERDDATLICVTLNDSNDWQDHMSLYDSCFENMEEQELPQTVSTIKLDVVGGTEEYVHCFSPTISANLPIGKAHEVTSVVTLKKFLYAPVAQRETVGEIRYYYKDKLIAPAPVYTGVSVYAQQTAEQGVFSYYYDKIAKWLR